MSYLPKGVTKVEKKSPRKLAIISRPKVGKSSLMAQLGETLIFDLEKGYAYVDSTKVDIKSLAEEKKVQPLQIIFDVCAELKASNKPYKRIAIDTVTELENMMAPFALKLYQSTPMGANYKDHILKLPNGAGYQYLREAFFKTIDEISSCADEIIFIGHVKDTLINKDGKEINSRELDLTGKIKGMLSADVDAIGILYRTEGSKNILSFVTSEEVVCGSRCSHLRNKEIVISELINSGEENEELITHWDKIYID